MANNLTTVALNLLLDLASGKTSAAPFTTPTKVALVTAAGSASANGTEVTGGSYARQNVTMNSAASGAATNSAAVSFTNMPAATVVGVEIWDSAATPKRIWFGPLSASKTTAAGDTFTIAAGSLSLSLS
ncbi:hypothetical protein [Kineococcus sp. NPDC059986]|uniref:phage tail fiber protein n=1 Tax=Kineococcus sp. NPDC059986 TaxID=3155538 RepID=UPI00344CCCBA